MGPLSRTWVVLCRPTARQGNGRFRHPICLHAHRHDGWTRGTSTTAKRALDPRSHRFEAVLGLSPRAWRQRLPG